MCGICVFILSNGCLDSEMKEKITRSILESELDHRGPDIQNTLQKTLNAETHSIFYGSTLHFRGNLAPQPLLDDLGNVLLWNGEIFDGLKVPPDDNDGAVLLTRLGRCGTDQDILRLMAEIRGPWAFVYLKASQNKLWFGRDVFGRRSLLYHSKTEGTIALASIAIKPWTPWQEVPAIGIYCVALKSCSNTDSLSPPLSSSSSMGSVTLYPWAEPSDSNSDSVKNKPAEEIFNKTLMSRGPPLDDIDVVISQTMIVSGIKPFNRNIPESVPDLEMDSGIIQSVDSIASDHQRGLADGLTTVLAAAVKVRTICQSEMCSRCIEKHLGRVTDSIEAVRKTISEMNNSDNTFPATGSSPAKTVSNPTLGGDSDPGGTTAFSKSEYSLTRGTTNDVLQGNIDGCIQISEHKVVGAVGCGHARVAVLFSGGLDSLVIAALADRYVPDGEPIDLVNVAFEQRKIVQPQGKKDKKMTQPSCCYDVPDRVTGREGLEQLISLNPHRQWNFVQVDVTLEELQRTRADNVKDLVYPLNTVLDDSIGCAIWFASRGQGVIINPSGDSIPYISPARVVLVGMGADEQLVGYSRHRVLFNTGGWLGLVDEIQMEIERISSRNLGRDDRVISDHSRESRFPFLDEHVVSFLNKLPLNDKCDLRLPRGIGEKFLLRLAAERLGLTRGAVTPKRAIQFGSRIAKAENKKEKGSDSCDRL